MQKSFERQSGEEWNNCEWGVGGGRRPSKSISQWPFICGQRVENEHTQPRNRFTFCAETMDDEPHGVIGNMCGEQVKNGKECAREEKAYTHVRPTLPHQIVVNMTSIYGWALTTF